MAQENGEEIKPINMLSEENPLVNDIFKSSCDSCH